MEENIFKEQILARLQQAVETLEDAKTMFKTQSYRSSINRAYYSMFYSAHALVYLTNENKSKHVGIIEVFDKYFVKTGIFSKQMSKQLHKAFDTRNFTDYQEIVRIDEKTAIEILENSEVFVNTIISFFKEKYSLFSIE